jgi:hypothetical protein
MKVKFSNSFTDLTVISYGSLFRPVHTFTPSFSKTCLIVSTHHTKSRDSAVGIATGWSSSPGSFKNFHFSNSSRLALGSTQPRTQWVPEVKWPGHETDHSPLAIAEVNENESIFQLPHMSSWCSAWLIKHGDNFTLPITLSSPNCAFF